MVRKSFNSQRSRSVMFERRNKDIEQTPSEAVAPECFRVQLHSEGLL